MSWSLQEDIDDADADAERLADWFEAEGPDPANQVPVLDYYLELLADTHAVDKAQLAATVELVREHGATWEQVADALDMTAPDAERRFSSAAAGS